MFYPKMMVLRGDLFFRFWLIRNCLLNSLNQTNRKKLHDMEFLSASLGATLDEINQRLIDCDFT